MNGRNGQCVERHGGVVQEQDKLRRENWLFLRDIESRISAHLAGNSEVSSRDLLRDCKSCLPTPFPHIPSHNSNHLTSNLPPLFSSSPPPKKPKTNAPPPPQPSPHHHPHLPPQRLPLPLLPRHHLPQRPPPRPANPSRSPAHRPLHPLQQQRALLRAWEPVSLPHRRRAGCESGR